MEDSTDKIVAGSITIVTTIFSGLWKLYSNIKSHITDIVKQEHALISQRISEMEKDIKETEVKLNIRLDSIVSQVSDIKALNTSTVRALELIQSEIKNAIRENTATLKAVHQSQIEHISPTLSFVKNKKVENE